MTIATQQQLNNAKVLFGKMQQAEATIRTKQRELETLRKRWRYLDPELREAVEKQMQLPLGVAQ